MLRVQVDGRRRDYGIGSLDILSLAEAREKAAQGRKWAKAGIDPSLEWKKERAEIPTFKAAAIRYHQNIETGWKKGKHSLQWLATLESYAYPHIGDLPVTVIDTTAIHKVLLPIWLKVPETARRVRQRIGAVLDYAHGQGWRASEAPMRAVSKGLPKQPRKGEHFAAMPYSDLPDFMEKVRGLEATTGRLALQFTILTAARSGETRGATWGEIDLEAKLWTIPGERMKAGQAHVVPLSAPAVAILTEMRGLFTTKAELVFPGLKRKALSDMTLAKALKTAGGEGYTVHGMRSAFRDWVAEKMPTVPGDVAEAALAHAIPNKVEAAYRRTKFLEQRTELMDKWADYLAGKSNVVRLASNG
ncbi:integrase [Sphingobium fuliginis]|uniref:Integrase n=1 Tax=Sphingobium fuliginis (strain ATCC 27551) TaxID=336203 RepID=A0A292Z8S6_SPHSA|nr:integrase [Sphingobium fuliginis]